MQKNKNHNKKYKLIYQTNQVSIRAMSKDGIVSLKNISMNDKMKRRYNKELTIIHVWIIIQILNGIQWECKNKGRLQICLPLMMYCKEGEADKVIEHLTQLILICMVTALVFNTWSK